MKQRGHEDCCGNCQWWGAGLTSWNVRAPCTDPDSRCVGWCPPRSHWCEHHEKKEEKR